LGNEIGISWLASAKIARKAGQWQTAYSAMLQARQSSSQFSFIESAKLVKATGEPLRALQELEKSIRLFDIVVSGGDEKDEDEMKKMKAKVINPFLLPCIKLNFIRLRSFKLVG
jgi:serine/threonine-protein kinase ATR